MTTPARAGQFTGATDNEANGGLFTDSKIDGIPDLVAADVASAQTSATTATTQAATATTQAATATTKATEAAASATAAAASQSAAATSATNAASSATTASNAVSSVSTNATNAATSETNAATSATNAAASASTASTQATSATTQANSALSSASAASTSATNAATSATNAGNSATAAANSATASANSATAAANSFDSFDDRYLGAKSSNPSTDNDGDTLLDGALYFNTTDNVMFVYDLGNTSWVRTTPTTTAQGHINTVSGIASNVTSVANNETNINAAVSNASNINSAVSNASNINTVAGNTTNINTVAGVSSNVTSVANIASDVTSLANSLEKTYTVTVTNPGSGNVFVLGSDGNAPQIEMFRGNTYVFNQSDATNDGHPLVFKNGSSAYEVGVTYFLNGSETTQANYVNTTTFNAGRTSGVRKVQIEVASNAPSSGLRYYCYVHGNGMGNTITVKDSNVSLVAGSITNVNNTGNNIANVNTVGGAIANVNTVATNITGVNTFTERYRVASSEPTSSLDEGDLYFNTTTDTLNVYNGSAFQPTAPSAANQANINIVAGEVTAQEDLGSIANAVSTSSGSNINTVGQNISNVNTVAGISSNVTAVAGNATNINTVAGNNANVTTVAGISSNVTAVAGNASNINAVQANATNINTVAGAATNINTVAANVTGVNSFAERYRVSSSAPTSSLDEGDLYYNTTANSLNYYNGSTFVPVVAGAMTSLVVDTSPQLGGDLDVNGNAIVSTSSGNIAITPNGTGQVVLTRPKLAGALDVNGNSIVSVSNGDITIAPNGSGEINLNGTVNTDNLTIDFGSIA